MHDKALMDEIARCRRRRAFRKAQCLLNNALNAWDCPESLLDAKQAYAEVEAALADADYAETLVCDVAAAIRAGAHDGFSKAHALVRAAEAEAFGRDPERLRP